MKERGNTMSEEVPENIREQVDELAEEYGIDKDRARQRYLDKLEDVRDEVGDSLPDERVFKVALRSLRGSSIAEMAAGGEEVEFVAVGQGGFQPWSVRDSDGNLVDNQGNIVDSKDDAAKKDVLIGYGVLAREGVKGGRAPCAFIMDESDDIDIDHFATLFEPGAALRGTFNVSESEELSEHFRAFSTTQTDVEVVDEPELVPDTHEERMEWVREAADDATIADISQSLSATNSDGYTVEFGVDFKRIDGDVVDYYKDESGGTYIYTILDESVMDGGEEALSAADVMDEDSDSQTPGMTCWANSNNMKYAEGTVGEFFGSVRAGEDGRITMDLYGINPVYGNPIDDDGEEAGDNVESVSL